jgi:predicted transglutaminase-like cysteine proteinase
MNTSSLPRSRAGARADRRLGREFCIEMCCPRHAWVNEQSQAITDLEHWAWSSAGFPTTEGRRREYAAKRKMLIEAGWPREALLITVVRDKKGEAAVPTVKNAESSCSTGRTKVLAWTETGYRFVKRQSQSDPNVWVSLGDSRPAVATASARDR